MTNRAVAPGFRSSLWLVACSLAVLFAQLSWPAQADACSCEARTFCEHFVEADVVLRLRPLKEKETDAWRLYRAQVRSVIKGDVGRKVTLATPLSTASCGLELAVGRRAEPVLLAGRIAQIDGIGEVIEVTACDFIQNGPVSRDLAMFASDPEAGACPQCRSDDDCPNDQFCNAASMCARRCRSNADCRDGRACHGGECLPGCESDADCGTGWCGPRADGQGFTCSPFRGEGEACNLGASQLESEPCGPGMVCACLGTDPDEAGDEGECEPTCHRVPPPNVCGQEPESGPCLAAFQRWYFDRESGGCRTFTWGGCGGNDNNFESAELCKEMCGGATPCGDTSCRPHQKCRLFEDTARRPCRVLRRHLRRISPARAAVPASSPTSCVSPNRARRLRAAFPTARPALSRSRSARARRRSRAGTSTLKPTAARSSPTVVAAATTTTSRLRRSVPRPAAASPIRATRCAVAPIRSAGSIPKPTASNLPIAPTPATTSRARPA